MMNKDEKKEISNEVQNIEKQEQSKPVHLNEIEEKEEEQQKVPWDRPNRRY